MQLRMCSSPEYDLAMERFASDVIDGIVALNPIVGGIQWSESTHAGPTRNVAGEVPLDHSMFHVEQVVTLDKDIVRFARLDEYITKLCEIGMGVADQLEKHFIQTVLEVTEAAGNVVDLNGAPLDFDRVIDAIERTEIHFDDDGNWIKPHLMMNPRDIEKLALVPPTDEQSKRLEMIVQTRKEELDAKKRTRRLSR